MNRNPESAPHLDAEELEAMLRSSACRVHTGEHLEACQPCRDEVASLAQVLDRFRATSAVYARNQLARQPRLDLAKSILPASRSATLPRWGWTLAACACACMLTVSAPLHRWTPAMPAATTQPPGAQPGEISDDALLQGVQDDLSTSIPSPLQSLTPSDHSRTVQR